MKRSINNSSLRVPKTEEEYIVTSNYCPIPPRKSNNNQEIETPTEVDLLLTRYRELIIELNKIRGKLYTLGINPEK